MLIEFSKTHGLEYANSHSTKLIHRNRSFCVVKVSRFYRPKAELKKFRSHGGTNSFAVSMYCSPGYYLIRLAKPGWSTCARNPRTNRKWRYSGHLVHYVNLSKNWRNNVNNLITACDALGGVK